VQDVEPQAGAATAPSDLHRRRHTRRVQQDRADTHQHCAEVGRDPAEILLPSQVPLTGDPAHTAARAAGFGAAGADLAIIYRPQPYTAAVLEPLANALSALA